MPQPKSQERSAAHAQLATIPWAVSFTLAHIASAIESISRKDYRGAWASLSNAKAYAESAANMKEKARRRRKR